MPAKAANSDWSVVIAAAIAAAIFVAGRIAGSGLFDNSWSFSHWQHLPLWYVVTWLIALVVVAAVMTKWLAGVAAFWSDRGWIVAGGGLVLVLIFLSQFDSFLYGGGNIRIRQVAQTDDVIVRWFEYGSILAVQWLHRFYELFGFHYNRAGVFAWKTVALAATGLSFVGALKLASKLSQERLVQLALFVVVFFGPHSILLFGFVGIEPMVVAITVWVVYLMVLLGRRYSVKRLLVLLGMVLVGIFVHASLVYLLPAVLFACLALRPGDGTPRRLIISGSLALVLGLVMLVALQVEISRNLELARQFLGLSGKPPHTDYSVFSQRHLGDMIQVLFLVFPLAVVLLLLLVRQGRAIFRQPLPLAMMIMALSGLALVWMTDPTNGIVLDLPRLTAYLTPAGVLLAILLRGVAWDNERLKAVSLALVAALSLLLPLSYLPVFVRIEYAEGYVETYVDRHDAYWRSAAPALRDAYFYRKDLDKANQWDRDYIVKSPDYMNLVGISELAEAGGEKEALRSLNHLMARNPFWADARSLYARIQMSRGQYDLAKPHIDTALMLEPYGKTHHMNRYRYYRDIQQFHFAVKFARQATELFPSDKDIWTDLMIAYFRSGALDKAEDLADSLMAVDSSLPYPHLIQGFIFEAQGALEKAVEKYFDFVTLAPDEVETPRIRERRQRLLEEIESRQGEPSSQSEP